MLAGGRVEAALWGCCCISLFFRNLGRILGCLASLLEFHLRPPFGSAAEESGYPLLKPLVARDHEREGPTACCGRGGGRRPEGFRRGYPDSSAAEPPARTSFEDGVCAVISIYPVNEAVHVRRKSKIFTDKSSANIDFIPLAQEPVCLRHEGNLQLRRAEDSPSNLGQCSSSSRRGGL